MTAGHQKAAHVAVQQKLIEDPRPDSKPETAAQQAPKGLAVRAISWAYAVRRRAGTIVVIGFALMIGWHAVTGKNGLTSWQEKRVQDKQLHKEIDQLQVENARLQNRVDHLKNDPDAIEQEARQQLHYARPNEVIYALPAQKNSGK